MAAANAVANGDALELPPIRPFTAPADADAAGIADGDATDGDPPITAEDLSGLKFFKDMEHRLLQSLIQSADVVRCEAGACLFRQGDPPGSCYVIRSGEVRIFSLSEREAEGSKEEEEAKGGRSSPAARLLDFMPGKWTVDGFSRYHEGQPLGNVVATIGPGTVCGENALLTEAPRPNGAKCLQDCVFLRITKAAFDNVLKAELIAKGDRKTRFLMQHVPGLRDVPVPKPGTKPHASEFFRSVPFSRGEAILTQGLVSEQAVYAVYRGSVEFCRTVPGGGASAALSGGAGFSASSSSGASPRSGGAGSGGLTSSSSLPALGLGNGRGASVAGGDDGSGRDKVMPSGVRDKGNVDRAGVLVTGGVFGTLPVRAPEPFTVRVTSAICEVLYVSGSDIGKLPKKLLDVLNDYLATTTAWRLRCHAQQMDDRCSRRLREQAVLSAASRADPQMPKSLRDMYCEYRRKRDGPGGEKHAGLRMQRRMQSASAGRL
eukprot:TRINITY_DN28376_c0_g1_i1.p1 TRINITY_DN28376_c0_g1~~TRINITY_DN28376_c0_g1_i1.p1  ORF type:complete len:489 (+),score=104.18 TRINITY_DN28376_c0_g1_i1:167-1633(+)